MHIQLQDDGTFDISYLPAQSSLADAVTISLFTNLRDDTTEVKHGWWANDLLPHPVGSKLWTLARAKRSEQTRQLALTYAKEALQWLVDDGHAHAITVTAAWYDTLLLLQITIDGTNYQHTLNYG